jgi:hypothetical protein
MSKTYLGDSVYAEYNEYHEVILTTENGLPDDPSNKIILEGNVISALEQFVKENRVKYGKNILD